MARTPRPEANPEANPEATPVQDRAAPHDVGATVATNPDTTADAGSGDVPLEQLFVVTKSVPGRELGLVRLRDGRPPDSEDWLRAATALDVALACGRFRDVL